MGGAAPERRNLTDALSVALSADGAAAARVRAVARQLAGRLRAADRPSRVHAGGRGALLAAAGRPRLAPAPPTWETLVGAARRSALSAPEELPRLEAIIDASAVSE